jgi:pilus assembly protein CpaF
MALNRELVLRLQAEVGERRTAQRQARRAQRLPDLTGEAERQYTRPIIRDVVEAYVHRMMESTGQPMPDEVQAELVKALDARLFGAGPFQHLLDNDKVEDIHCNGYDRVFVRYADGIDEQVDPICDSNEELVQILQDLASYTGLSSRPFDTSNVELDLRLPDGSRLSATQGVSPWPTVSIRRHRHPTLDLAHEEELGTVDADQAGFLRAAVTAKKNIMIAGGTGAGKTTLLRALASEIAPTERLVTVERTLELGLHEDEVAHPNCVPFEERQPNAEGEGGVSLSTLVRRSLRMSPDRVIVGEVLGDEVVTMLNAMTQGNDGSLSTIHANSAREVVPRLCAYAIQAQERLPMEATQMLIAGALDFIVFMRKVDQQRRVVESVIEITGFDGNQATHSHLWQTSQIGERGQRTAAQVTCFDELVAAGWQPATPAWGVGA